MELTKKQLSIMAQFIAAYYGGDKDDYLDEPIDLTRDDMDRYDGSGWREADGREDSVESGYPAHYFESVQLSKGQPRRSLFVVDFGDFRAVYHG